MRQQSFEFNRQYGQIVKGLNRIRYIKNKQNHLQSKINAYLLRTIAKSSNPQNSLLQHVDDNNNDIIINSTNLSPRQHHQSHHKHPPRLQIQQNNSLNMIQVYTNRMNLDKIKKAENQSSITSDNHFRQSKNTSSLKATDISQDCGPLQQDTSYNQISSFPSAQAPQKIKIKQLIAQKSMNYLTMKQNQRSRQKQIRAKLTQDHTLNLHKKYLIHRQKIQAKKKIEEQYFQKLEDIYQQKSLSNSKKINTNLHQIQEVYRLRQQQVQQIEQFEQALLLGDHLRIAILQHLKSQIKTDPKDQNYRQQQSQQPLGAMIDLAKRTKIVQTQTQQKSINRLRGVEDQFSQKPLSSIQELLHSRTIAEIRRNRLPR